jgi:hypothetical protein
MTAAGAHGRTCDGSVMAAVAGSVEREEEERLDCYASNDIARQDGFVRAPLTAISLRRQTFATTSC